MKIKTITIRLGNVPLDFSEISAFRRAFNDYIDWQHPIFHNHTDDRKEIYRYPLVQYRCQHGVAVLFGINEGVEYLRKLFLSDLLPIEWRKNLKIEENETELALLEKKQSYYLYRFLPMNTEYYEQWRKMDSLIERAALLEKLTTNHLLNFCKEMGFWIKDKGLIVSLKRMDKRPMVEWEASGEKMRFLCFDITIETNLRLPQGIGLGKGKGKGFGSVYSLDTKHITEAIPEENKRKEG